MFITYDDYKNYGSNLMSEDEAFVYLRKAERQINTLCFNRISNDTIKHYMPATQEIVKEIICEQADFLFSKKEEINNGIIKKYSNNSASVEYASNAYNTRSGILINDDLYSELVSTGLCYRGFI